VSDLLVRGIGRLRTLADGGVDETVGAAVAIRNGRVEWAGSERELPAGLGELPELAVGGACVVPGFVDAHTHAVWAGTRRAELVARLQGERYDGGGIVTTVRATTSATDDELLDLARHRLAAMSANGTTTVEVKTGYGLAPEEELRLVSVAATLASKGPLDVEVTYLAHVPDPARDRADHVAATIAALPDAAARGARWCDVFCDRGAFTVEESRSLLAAARSAGLGLRLHADQLGPTGGAALAAETGCASADHLEHVTPAAAAAMVAAGVVGVLLPTATLATRGRAFDSATVLRGAGVRLALGTDCNPGTSWCESMPYAMQLACFLLGLSVEEALRAATTGSAASLRRTDVGTLAPGTRGDLAVLAADHEADLVAHLGAAPVAATVARGRILHSPGH
jgi:imidazolonepropionase